MRKVTGLFSLVFVTLLLAFGGNAKAEDKKTDGGAALAATAVKDAAALAVARDADKKLATGATTKTEVKVDPAGGVDVTKTATPGGKTPTTLPDPKAAPAKADNKAKAGGKKGGGGRLARVPSNLEPIVLDWTSKFECVAYGTGYPVSVKPDISLDPGMQPKEAVCLGKKAEIIARQGLGADKKNEDGEVIERARDVEPVLSLSASANGFAQSFIDQESKKVGRPLSQQEVQDRLDCMRAAKAWGITSGKVLYARTAVSAHTMGASRNDRRFTQDGKAASGAVGGWCLDKSEVWSLEDAREMASRGGGGKKLKELEERQARLEKRTTDLEENVDRINGKIAGHDAILVNLDGRVQDLERRRNWFNLGVALRLPFRRPANVMGGLDFGWVGHPTKGEKLLISVQAELLMTRDYYLLSQNGLPNWSLGAAGQIVIARRWSNGFYLGGVAEGSIAQSVSLEEGRPQTHGTTHWSVGGGAATGYDGKRLFVLGTITGGVEAEMVKQRAAQLLLPVKPDGGGAFKILVGIKL